MNYILKILCGVLLFFGSASADIFDPENSTNRWVCGQDLNGNGYAGESGETAVCLGNLANAKYCPIGAAQCQTVSNVTTTAPTKSCANGATLVNGVCSKEVTECKYNRRSGQPIYYVYGHSDQKNRWYYWNNQYICRTTQPKCAEGHFRGALKDEVSDFENGDEYYFEICLTHTVTSEPTLSCEDGLSLVNGQCQDITYTDVCPLGNYDCVANGQNRYCSANSCVDLEDETTLEETEIDGKLLINDGETNDEGLCLEQVYIYSGRKQRCKTPGVQSAFQNCCKDSGQILQDSGGSYAYFNTAINTVTGLYNVAETAYITYNAQVAAGVSQAFAAELATSAAQQQFLVAFDPTTIAISVAMYFVMEWIANACDQMDMETSMAKSSGYCVEIGSFCKKKVAIIGCVQKANAFCCFNSKLARIIHEQGRPQLTTLNSFGTPKEPNCRGFTPEEFQSIDFGQIDLTEYIDDISRSTQGQIEENIQSATESFFNGVR